MPRPLNMAPYYAIEVEPVLHHTMGRIQINSKAEVGIKQEISFLDCMQLVR